MILLDTNVLSALMPPNEEDRVIAWLDQQPRISIWTTAITVLETRFGIDSLPEGKRRSRLIAAFENILEHQLAGRVAEFDAVAAAHAADLMAKRQRAGRTVDLRDTMIAGIAIARRATLATRNVRHFEDLSVPVVNPWLTGK